MTKKEKRERKKQDKGIVFVRSALCRGTRNLTKCLIMTH